jgi:AcrR family transcriptional regulator
MNDQVDPGPATRERIVHAAMELFWEKGYQSTSVADLLKRADAHSGSLYHFFPGKQDVLVAVLQAYERGIDEMLLAPVWEGVDDPIERVFALLAKYRELIVVTGCTYGCPIGSLALALFVLTTMEGGVMLARTYRDVAKFDAAVAQLRDFFARLLRDPGAARRRQPRRR